MWHLRLENLESGDHLWNGSFLSGFMDFRHCFFRLDFKLPLSVIIYNMSSKKQKEIHVFFQIPGDNYQQSVKTRFFHSYLIQISIGRLRGTHKTHLLNCLINLHAVNYYETISQHSPGVAFMPVLLLLEWNRVRFIDHLSPGEECSEKTAEGLFQKPPSNVGV